MYQLYTQNNMFENKEDGTISPESVAEHHDITEERAEEILQELETEGVLTYNGETYELRHTIAGLKYLFQNR